MVCAVVHEYLCGGARGAVLRGKLVARRRASHSPPHAVHTWHDLQPIASGYRSAVSTDQVCRAHASVAVSRLADMVQATVLEQAQERASGITLRVLRA